MIKEIKYNGFTETPSDYSCPDGDLATAIGLVHEDEGLRPIQTPVLWFSLPDGYEVIFIHRHTSGYLHYIVRHGDNYYWIDEMPKGTVLTTSDFNSDNILITLTDKTYYDINAIGNTLIIFASDGTHYFLWDAQLSNYKSLGMHIPECDISFGLQGTPNKGEVSHCSGAAEPFIEEFGEDYKPYVLAEKLKYTSENFINYMTDNVMALVNKRIAEAHQQGKFIFPFLVRYAYQLYDTTLVMHSAPVLMVTDSYCNPHVFITDAASFVEGDKHFDFRVGTMECDLYYHLRTNLAQTLRDWEDIVQSVDIYISAPIWTFNQSEKVVGQSIKNYPERGYSISRTPTDTRYMKYHTSDKLIDNYGGNIEWIVTPGIPDVALPILGKLEVDLHRFSDDEIQEKITSCHDFYLLKSIPIGSMVYNQDTKIEVPEYYLQTLVNREAMTEDYDSHAQLIPRFSFSYNQRLTIANVSKIVPAAFSPIVATCHNETNDSVVFGGREGNALYQVWVYLKIDGRVIVVTDNRPLQDYMTAENAILYYFYPDPNAYKAVFHRRYYGRSTTSWEDDYFSIDLKRHDFLNGAVYFSGWSPVYGSVSEAPVVSDNLIVELPNRMYTSELSNPFVFLSKGVNTIGVSSIIGIRPAVKAMSPSQFGQFKFYVFAGDGVWALEVSSSGYLEMPQLVTPDITLGNGESITQIDGAVLFASARGIMMLSGSTCTCISDILTSPSPFLPFAADASNDLLPKLRAVCGDSVTLLSQVVPFLTYIQDCRMLYDYPHQRIIIYSPTHSYAYVFSLKSKHWTMMPSDIQSTVNYFPNALSLNSEGEVVNYSEDPVFDVLSYVNGTIITRPFKLEPQDALKTITSIIQRGQFRKGHVKTVLYGSRDLFNWQLVWSSEDHYLRGFSGTPYKYYRLALLCSMSPDESIFGCSIDFQERYTNRLR